ncbi:PQQ-binding-like beta-propeller repeat protein [Thalassoroseus pseudoceratinae]|uniref:PQQ-binding-like beta-propeller repeat protein n=1 Tax=Thalassoroseus pseudoceratinae TaxID=2713176 RepID=UPI001F10542C|nr:PQQ-binding-like beta-propeller repeat protein [Thalassoroseus pseudoceratinae]
MKNHFSIAALVWVLVWPTMGQSANWPEFRGPTGEGIATVSGLPVEWSPDKNVVWKTPVPGLGWSSPIVLGEQIFLTTAVGAEDDQSGPQKLRVLSFDVATGKPNWNVEVFAPRDTSMHKKNSHASPTPITDGEHIFVHFGAYGTAALTTDGKVLWRQTGIDYRMQHGTGGSPILVDDLLVFSCDGSDVQFVVALDKSTGKIRWKKDRPAIKNSRKFSFSTPLAIEVDGQTQIISPATDQVVAYAPQDGRELWSLPYSGYSVIPRPVYGGGLLYLATSYNTSQLLAIRPGTQDSEAEIVWKLQRGAPHTPSVVYVDGMVFLVSDRGIGTCVDAATGTVHWQKRLGGNYSASPLYSEGRVYFQSEQGVGTVVRASKEYEVLAENDMKERTLASYAVAEKDLLIRTETQLYRVSATP